MQCFASLTMGVKPPFPNACNPLSEKIVGNTTSHRQFFQGKGLTGREDLDRLGKRGERERRESEASRAA